MINNTEKDIIDTVLELAERSSKHDPIEAAKVLVGLLDYKLEAEIRRAREIALRAESDKRMALTAEFIALVGPLLDLKTMGIKLS